MAPVLAQRRHLDQAHVNGQHDEQRKLEGCAHAQHEPDQQTVVAVGRPHHGVAELLVQLERHFDRARRQHKIAERRPGEKKQQRRHTARQQDLELPLGQRRRDELADEEKDEGQRKHQAADQADINQHTEDPHRAVGDEVRVHLRVVHLHPLQRPAQQVGGFLDIVGDQRHEDAKHHGTLDECHPQVLEVVEKTHGLAFGRFRCGLTGAAVIIFVHWWLVAQAPS